MSLVREFSSPRFSPEILSDQFNDVKCKALKIFRMVSFFAQLSYVISFFFCAFQLSTA